VGPDDGFQGTPGSDGVRHAAGTHQGFRACAGECENTAKHMRS